MCRIFLRSWLGTCIVLLVLLVVALQVFHMSLLTRLEAKETQDQTMPVARKERSSFHIIDEMIEKIRNSHKLDYSGTYYIIENLLIGEYRGSGQTRDVSIVTQCSSNHLYHLIYLVERWDGPVSVTVFTFDKDVEFALHAIAKLYSCNENIRKYVYFHLVFPINRTPTSIADQSKHLIKCDDDFTTGSHSYINYGLENIEYPHNLLRNLAIKYSPSSFVFMIDIDMIPSTNLRQDFLQLCQTLKGRTKETVFVVPAFEAKEAAIIPATKSDLLTEWSDGGMSVRPFYKEACWKCQRHTDYKRWQELKQTPGLRVAYNVQWKDPWEPFFIGSKSMPLYDERFKQYGFNRISQVCELHIAQFTFSVLDNAFLVHKGFKSPQKFHSTKEQELDRNRLLFRKFKEELKVKYHNSTRRCY